jgi:hypothetical protein
MKWAKKGWTYYMKDKGIKIAGSARRDLPPLREMRNDALLHFLRLPQVAPIHKARLWHNLDLPTRQAAYDRLKPYFEELCAAQDPPFAPVKTFPEPPGMEEFRQTNVTVEDDLPPIEHGTKN